MASSYLLHMDSHFNRALWLIGLVLVLGGCTPEPLPITLEQAPVKLVIASQVIPGDIMIVTVTKSFGALTFDENEDDADQGDAILQQLLVDSALVTIAYEGIVDTLFVVPDVPGVYWSVSTPQILNTTYELNALDYRTGLTASAQAEMLEQATFNTITATNTSTDNIDRMELAFEFDDIGPESNWYVMTAFPTDVNSGSGDPFNENEIPTTTLLLSDSQFSSDVISGSHEVLEFTADTLVVQLSHISREYHDYLALRAQGGDLLTSVLNEPINYPSNVENGYGYFLTHYPDVKVVLVDE